MSGTAEAMFAKFCMQADLSIASLGMNVTRFLNFAPIISLELVKLSTSNFECGLIRRSITACVTYYLQKGCVQIT